MAENSESLSDQVTITQSDALAQDFANVNLHRVQESCALGDCKHLLKDAGYNDESKLAFKLDGNTATNARKNIINLMHNILESSNFIRIWRSVQGSEKPAMDLLLYLSVGKLMNLRTFLTHVRACRHERLTSALNKIINENPEVAEKVLSELDLVHLDLIVDHLSDNPQGPAVGMSCTWRNVASNIGLDRDHIRYLECSLERKESLTMELIAYLTAKHPEYTIAKLGHEIYQIDRKDAIVDCAIFKKCLNKKCLSFSKEGNPDEAVNRISATDTLQQSIRDEIDANNGDIC